MSATTTSRDSEPEALLRVIEEVRRIWPTIWTGTEPPAPGSFSFRVADGNGSTSKRFLMTVADSAGPTRKFFVKFYGRVDRGGQKCLVP